MKVVLYSTPFYLDATLSLINELSKVVELHFVLEINPGSWNSSLFDMEKVDVPSGIVSFAELKNECAGKIAKYVKNCASVNLSVFQRSKLLSPETLVISYKTAKFIKKISPDIVYMDGGGLRAAILIRQLKNFKIVQSIHDPFPHSGEVNWRKKLEKAISLRCVHSFVLHNGAQVEDFINFHKVDEKRVSVIPLGIYDIYKEWIKKKEVRSTEKIVLFFGRLSEYKGVNVLLDAAVLVASQIPKVKFIVAGKPVPGYQIPDLPDMPEGSSLELHASYISNERLVQLFQMATLVVCPYLDATQSGVILTAYAFRKPVVATKTGGLAEYVYNKRSGILVEPKNPVELADAITSVLTNEDFLEYLENGTETISNDELSWYKIAEKTFFLLQKVRIS